MKRICFTVAILTALSNVTTTWAKNNEPISWSSEKYFVCDTNIKNLPDIEKTGLYEPDSLQTEGFIHCTRASQLFFVANKFYSGDHMMLWLIDPLRLISSFKYEGKLNSNLYPHVYGPINMSAVIDTKKMKPNSDGTYDIPPEFFSTAWKSHPKHFAFCAIEQSNWVNARLQGEYKPDNVEYIPCFKSKKRLIEQNLSNQIIVVVDIRKVEAPIKLEGKSNADLNPHIYGALNMDAVTAVLDLNKDANEFYNA